MEQSHAAHGGRTETEEEEEFEDWGFYSRVLDLSRRQAISMAVERSGAGCLSQFFSRVLNLSRRQEISMAVEKYVVAGCKSQFFSVH